MADSAFFLLFEECKYFRAHFNRNDFLEALLFKVFLPCWDIYSDFLVAGKMAKYQEFEIRIGCRSFVYIMISMPPVIIFLKCLPKIKAWIFTMITLCLFVLSVYLNNRYTTTEVVPNTLFYFAVASSVLTATVGLLQVNTAFVSLRF